MLLRNRKLLLVILIVTAALSAAVFAGYAQTTVPVKDDPLVRMPGTQPGQVALQAPTRCLNCHANYNHSVEPGFNWQGSMMAQASRDPIFWAAMTVAAQDSVWALGNANATDLCLRCHFPKGWLEGRSEQTNASLMTGADYDGVQCDFCHSMWDPFFEDTHAGVREGNDWLGYWDETNNSATPSQPAADNTYLADLAESGNIAFFNGNPFYTANQPSEAGYTEATSGQYYISSNASKRASFADAEARHQTFYSRFHKSKYMCATCHDVSNPALANLDFAGTLPGDGVTQLPSELQSAFNYVHVERTFSEFMLSDYGQQGGAPGVGPYSPDQFNTSYLNNNIAKCQDCHMRDVVGTGADKRGIPIRPNDSVEHPNSGQPLHDLTGGNAWVPRVLASTVAGSPNFNQVNADLLTQGPAALTLDLTQGEALNPEALLAAALRAEAQLQLAASIENLEYNAGNGTLSFRIQNQTGHKLISGFPEGRRIFIHIEAAFADGTNFEVNPYDAAAGTLKGLNYFTYDNGLQPPEPLTASQQYVDELVYEMHPSSSLTQEGSKSFHFVLSDGRYKDNRIPPKGFRIDGAAERLAVPVWHGVEDPNLFTAAEYQGGYDDVTLTIPAGADSVTVSLYYQSTSREYVEFLRNEINGVNTTLPTGDPSAYIIQTDPFFAQLRPWGDVIWGLWNNNQNLPGISPFLMDQAIAGSTPPPCDAVAPTLLTAAPGNAEVSLTWSAVGNAASYNLYYDQAGKTQLVANTGLDTSYLDSGLTNGQEYCYLVTSNTASCESGFSNLLCAVPNNQGQAKAGVVQIVTGTYAGKGGNITFVPATSFVAGDNIVFRAQVVDISTGLPLANATVELAISGPGSLLISSGPSDNSGIAEATWQTKARKGKSPGTPVGSYSAATSNLTAVGYTWDGLPTGVDFDLQ